MLTKQLLKLFDENKYSNAFAGIDFEIARTLRLRVVCSPLRNGSIRRLIEPAIGVG